MKIKLVPVVGFLAVLVALTCSAPMSVSAEEVGITSSQEIVESDESSYIETNTEEQMQTEAIVETPYGYYETLRVIGEVDGSNVEVMLKLVNELRVQNGEQPLVLDTELTRKAMIRAEEISVDFNHTRPGGGYSVVYPMMYGSENIGCGYSDVYSSFQGAKSSPGHFVNMIKPYWKSVGFGQFNNCWVMIFNGVSQGTIPSVEYLRSFTSMNKVASINIDPNVCPPLEIFDNYVRNETVDMSQTRQMKFYLHPAQSGTNCYWVSTLVDPSCVIWSSSNKSVASVDANGVVTGLTSGTSTITGTLNEKYTINCVYTVTSNGTPVRQMNGLSLTPSPISLEINKTSQLTATKLPVNCVNSDSISYTSLDPTVATVDSNGKVTAIKQGSTTITAKCGSYSSQTNVNVLSANFGVSYRTHVQNVGWQDYVRDGLMSGTEARSLRLEGINIKTDPTVSGGITYRTHVQNIGWQGWKSNDQMSGTEGMSYRLEGIEIKLTGDLATKYDVYYRVHTQNIGWMGWAKNGESSGSAGFSYRLEGIQIQLVAKGDPAPGSTVKPFVENKIE